MEKLNTDVYVDWADLAMLSPPDRKTGEKLKEKIKKYDRFVFIATDAAIQSGVIGRQGMEMHKNILLTRLPFPP